MSQHLKVLRDAGIVISRPDAQRRIYRLSDNGLDDIDEWLQNVGDSGHSASTVSSRYSARQISKRRQHHD
ncbi:MAG: hypothetical protein AAGA61_06045 [Pseudomonadota bacterium]